MTVDEYRRQQAELDRLVRAKMDALEAQHRAEARAAVLTELAASR